MIPSFARGQRPFCRGLTQFFSDRRHMLLSEKSGLQVGLAPSRHGDLGDGSDPPVDLATELLRP